MSILAQGDITQWKEPYRQIVSMDPAYVNFAICVYRIYNDDGRTERLLLEKRDFTEGMTDAASLVEQSKIWQNLQAWLNELDPIFQASHIFLIERQNSFSTHLPGGKQLSSNPKVMRAFGHVCGCLMSRYASKSLIAEVCPKLKGKMLEFPSHLSYAQTKSMSVKKAREFLETHQDTEGLAILKAAKTKKDDLADTINQWRAWIKRFPEWV